MIALRPEAVMSDDAHEHQLLNDVSAYIEAADIGDLAADWPPDVFREVAVYAWSHVECVRRRLVLLAMRNAGLDH